MVEATNQVNSVPGPSDKSKISFQVVSRSHDSHTHTHTAHHQARQLLHKKVASYMTKPCKISVVREGGREGGRESVLLQ